MSTAIRPTHPFHGARKMKPTKKHRPAIWECMLGTVYARNPDGVTRYFDYDWDGAREFAGVDTPDADPRVARVPRPSSGFYGSADGPVPGRLTLYVVR